MMDLEWLDKFRAKFIAHHKAKGTHSAILEGDETLREVGYIRDILLGKPAPHDAYLEAWPLDRRLHGLRLTEHWYESR